MATSNPRSRSRERDKKVSCCTVCFLPFLYPTQDPSPKGDATHIQDVSASYKPSHIHTQRCVSWVIPNPSSRHSGKTTILLKVKFYQKCLNNKNILKILGERKPIRRFCITKLKKRESKRIYAKTLKYFCYRGTL